LVNLAELLESVHWLRGSRICSHSKKILVKGFIQNQVWCPLVFFASLEKLLFLKFFL